MCTVQRDFMNSNAYSATLTGKGLSDIGIRNLFVIPTILFLILFNVFPLLYSLLLSFADYSVTDVISPVWVGLKNYSDILNDPDIWQNFSLTGKYVLITVLGQVIIGFGIALMLNRRFKGKGIVTVLLLLPMMISMAVVGLFWKLLWDTKLGIVNYLAGLDGFVWLSSPDWALIAVAITDIWMWSPFVMLLSLAGLSAVPKHLYEAASIDRASQWFIFRRITLPLVAPLLLIAIIFRTMEAFKTFDLAYNMTGGGTNTELVSIKLYNLAFMQWNTGKSCALAYILLIMVIAISNIYIKYLNKAKER
jgi:multiple sugar transport system permease protein